ncbi:MAG TPA: hypothetical protein VMU99_05655 [Acidimicrobiales bacterium]|nr:hypothetical protein [Acidimicrobiales bacterium]
MNCPLDFGFVHEGILKIIHVENLTPFIARHLYFVLCIVTVQRILSSPDDGEVVVISSGQRSGVKESGEFREISPPSLFFSIFLTSIPSEAGLLGANNG